MAFFHQGHSNTPNGRDLRFNVFQTILSSRMDGEYTHIRDPELLSLITPWGAKPEHPLLARTANLDCLGVPLQSDAVHTVTARKGP